MRRLDDDPGPPIKRPETDPIRDATVLLIGRGAAYPALSVSLGERIGVVGALSIEAAAKHLNVRDIDGMVLGEGFSRGWMDAFLTVLAEDARFRNLPVVLTSDDAGAGLRPAKSRDHPGRARADCRQRPAVDSPARPEVHLSRTLRAIDAGGLIDPLTGLLTPAAFSRDLATAVYHTRRAAAACRWRVSHSTRRIPVRNRRRADHRPPNAADGFRHRAS